MDSVSHAYPRNTSVLLVNQKLNALLACKDTICSRILLLSKRNVKSVMPTANTALDRWIQNVHYVKANFAIIVRKDYTKMERAALYYLHLINVFPFLGLITKIDSACLVRLAARPAIKLTVQVALVINTFLLLKEHAFLALLSHLS
jgi:hypothetical protein